jgi:hypothetical protein
MRRQEYGSEEKVAGRTRKKYIKEAWVCESVSRQANKRDTLN